MLVVAGYVTRLRGTPMFVVGNIVMILLLTIMIVESPTIYPIIYLIFAILICLPEAVSRQKSRTQSDTVP